MGLLEQVTEQLGAIQINDADISEYIAGIVQDESMDDDEKREIMSGFLSETTENDTDGVIATILDQWKSLQKDQAKQEAEQKAKQIEEAQAREIARREEMEKLRELNKAQSAAKQLTKEEEAQRKHMIQQFDYSTFESETDKKEEDGAKKNTKHNGRSLGKPRQTGEIDPLLIVNRNAEDVKEQEQKRRDQMKKQSELEKERNKKQQEKQKADKEKDKEKKKTQKKEKQRM